MFVKGQSGNPDGRPKGLARRVRELTDDLFEQVEEVIRIAKYSKSDRTRLEAIFWLADRAYGKAVETTINVEAGAEGKLALLEGLTLDQLGELASGKTVVGSRTVVALPSPPLQLPDVAGVNAESEGSKAETSRDNAESQSPKPPSSDPA